jgi:eukaryotic-like serine/threonine-protein kinase
MALTRGEQGHQYRPAVPGRVLPGRPDPPPNRPRRLRGLLVGLATFLAAGGIAAAVMLIANPLQRGAAPPPGGAAAAPVEVTPAGQPAQEAAAQRLAGLLARIVTYRSSIVAAVNDVSRCGPNLRQDPQTFRAAATSRQALLTRLARLPGRPALPGPMLAALTSAWQNSIKADRDFAQWARDEISGGCTSGNQSADPHARAAAGPDALATTGKQAFVGRWNPVATRYGLPTYRWNQL